MLTLIRGLPGSGKTTLAQAMSAVHVEADLFFMKEGLYIFDGKKIKEAHNWCQSITKELLKAEVDVVVSNTFTVMKELEPYLQMAHQHNASIKIVECTQSYGSTHDVPDITLERMKNRWDVLPDKLRYCGTGFLYQAI